MTMIDNIRGPFDVTPLTLEEAVASVAKHETESYAPTRSRTRQAGPLRRLDDRGDRGSTGPGLHNDPAPVPGDQAPAPDQIPPAEAPVRDSVNHPKHYNSHPSGIECITITRWMTFNLGNVFKYCWRADEKGATIEDLKKARWYLDDEIARLEKLRS